MSVWTHVAGVIRIDDIRFTDDLPDFDKLIGKECLWESDSSVWDDLIKNPDNYMPCGSEGSLEKSVWANPDKSCMSAYTISVFGDLRDYDTPQKIVDWFIDCCNKCMVRQAVITVETEGCEPLNYFYKEGI